MTKMPEIRITRYCIVFFPVARLAMVGDRTQLTVMGKTVYERAGDARQFLGLKWGSNEHGA